MIPAAFDYRRAKTIDEALALIGETAEEARFLAGGHSLIPLMKLRFSQPDRLVDIMHVPGLAGIWERNGQVGIGATTRYVELERSRILQDVLPVVAEAAGEIGDPQVRHRGTIGGSLAHADPAADLPAVMVALDAFLDIVGPQGRRRVQAEDFFQGFFTVDLAEGELITEMRMLPRRAAAYAKLHQKASHFALVGVAAALEIEAGNGAGGVCRGARVAVTGLSTHAQRLRGVEASLIGERLAEESIRAAAERAPEGIEEINDDLHGSAEYRREMAKVFAARAIRRAAARA